ncbi:unnamed protein product [Medioppia subpectinata]|uniref:C2H2-type domain-containing protein n=1 Tax=Medioppia subpectinata TaxID=1979941 RepID=A0A7R9PWG1_9ACAR|nr:unnamed protein product [Medioppia subpectinata]CAG2103306.1 unnamed protein product [Medioppia subpectinata]
MFDQRLVDELRADNQLLAAKVSHYQTCVDVLEAYRKWLIIFTNNNKSDTQLIQLNVVLDLEKQYKAVFPMDSQLDHRLVGADDTVAADTRSPAVGHNVVQKPSPSVAPMKYVLSPQPSSSTRPASAAPPVTPVTTPMPTPMSTPGVQVLPKSTPLSTPGVQVLPKSVPKVSVPPITTTIEPIDVALAVKDIGPLLGVGITGRVGRPPKVSLELPVPDKTVVPKVAAKASVKGSGKAPANVSTAEPKPSKTVTVSETISKTMANLKEKPIITYEGISRRSSPRKRPQLVETPIDTPIVEEIAANVETIDDKSDSNNEWSDHMYHKNTSDSADGSETWSATSGPIIDTNDEELTDWRAGDETPVIVSPKMVDTSLKTSANNNQTLDEIELNNKSVVSGSNTPSKPSPDGKQVVNQNTDLVVKHMGFLKPNTTPLATTTSAMIIRNRPPVTTTLSMSTTPAVTTTLAMSSRNTPPVTTTLSMSTTPAKSSVGTITDKQLMPAKGPPFDILKTVAINESMNVYKGDNYVLNIDVENPMISVMSQKLKPIGPGMTETAGSAQWIVGYRCNYNDCEFVSHDRNITRDHIVVLHTRDEPFVCDFCNKAFAMRDLEKHQKSSHADNQRLLIRCRFAGCHYWTGSKEKLILHYKQQHKVREEPTPPPQPSTPSTSSVALATTKPRQRAVALPPRSSIQMPIIFESFKTNQHNNNIGNGLRISNGPIERERLPSKSNSKIHACDWPDCDARFRTRGEVLNHMNRHMGQQNTMTKLKDLIRSGNYAITADPQNTALSLICEIDTMKEMGFKCNHKDCTFVNIFRHLMNQHLMTHQNKDSFACGHCGKAYGLKIYLAHHMMKYHKSATDGQKSTTTALRPGTTFSIRLGGHQRPQQQQQRPQQPQQQSSATNETLWRCSAPNCEFKSYNKYYFRRHALIKHGMEKEWKCGHCSATFKQRPQRTQHEHEAHGGGQHTPVAKRVSFGTKSRPSSIGGRTPDKSLTGNRSPKMKVRFRRHSSRVVGLTYSLRQSDINNDLKAINRANKRPHSSSSVAQPSPTPSRPSTAVKSSPRLRRRRRASAPNRRLSSSATSSSAVSTSSSSRSRQSSAKSRHHCPVSGCHKSYAFAQTLVMHLKSHRNSANYNLRQIKP